MNIYDLAREPLKRYSFVFIDGRVMRPEYLWFCFKKNYVTFLFGDSFYKLEIDDPLTISDAGFIMSTVPIETKRPKSIKERMHNEFDDNQEAG